MRRSSRPSQETLGVLDEPVTEPFGEVNLIQCAGGNGFHRFHGFGGIENELVAVVGEKKARDHPTGSLIA